MAKPKSKSRGAERREVPNAGSLSRTIKGACAVLQTLDTAYSRAALQLARAGDWVAVVNLPMPNPDQYDSADVFALDYLAWNLLRKSDFLPCGIDTKQVAMQAFLDSEEMCRSVNHFRCNPWAVRSGGNFSQTFEAVIHTAKAKIARLLGRFDWDECERYFGFSSGASTRLPRKSGHPFYKMQGKPDVTPAASVLAVCAIWRSAMWSAQLDKWNPEKWVALVRGSKSHIVPKTAKTGRFICAEPDMNMYLQRGIGQVLRNRLKTVGVDLDDQTRNQQLALIGSRTGSLATIDLKSASDSISLAIVEALLPYEWFQALMMTRSAYTQLPDGSWHELQKISSMGNGYTFELESLIFWALSSSVIDLMGCEDDRLAVYGDDIVIHNSVAQDLIEVLDYCGFQTNLEKTFVSGPFRESCGKHYFLGQDVTPFNIKDPVDCPPRAYWLVNSYNHWLTRASLVSDKTAGKAIRRLIKLYNLREQYVPGHYSDEAGLKLPSVADYPGFFSFNRTQGYVFSALRPVRRKHKPGGIWALLCWCATATSSREEPHVLMLEKGEVVYARFTRKTSVWPDSPVRLAVPFVSVNSVLT